MVRIPGRDEYFEAQLRHQQHQQQFLSQRRNPMVSSPYTTNNPQSYGYAYQPQQQRVPTPPSPPSEELGKPSLPSISSLLGIADGKRLSVRVDEYDLTENRESNRTTAATAAASATTATPTRAAASYDDSKSTIPP